MQTENGDWSSDKTMLTISFDIVVNPYDTIWHRTQDFIPAFRGGSLHFPSRLLIFFNTNHVQLNFYLDTFTHLASKVKPD